MTALTATSVLASVAVDLLGATVGDRLVKIEVGGRNRRNPLLLPAARVHVYSELPSRDGKRVSGLVFLSIFSNAKSPLALSPEMFTKPGGHQVHDELSTLPSGRVLALQHGKPVTGIVATTYPWFLTVAPS